VAFSSFSSSSYFLLLPFPDLPRSGSISLEELRELLLDDSILISKKSEANPSMVRFKSKSSLDLFQKLVAKEIIVDAVADALKGDDEDENQPPLRQIPPAPAPSGGGAAGGDIESGPNNAMVSSGKSMDVKSFASGSPVSAPSSSKNYFASSAKISPSEDDDKNEREGKESLV
jgi:hypothetical protein